MSRLRKIPHLEGWIFENLTVIKEVEKGKYGEFRYLCKCICGNEKIIVARSLIIGSTRSCGCILDLNIRMVRGWNYKDLTGMKFGRLICIERVFCHSAKRGCYWKCLCECGKEKEVRSQNLTSGRIKSCGCLSKKRPKEIRELKTK